MSYPTKTSPQHDATLTASTAEPTFKVIHRRKSSSENQQSPNSDISSDSIFNINNKRSLPTTNRFDMSIDQQISPRLNAVQLSSDFRHLVPNRSPSVSDSTFNLGQIDSNLASNSNSTLISPASPRSSIYATPANNNQYNMHSSISSSSSQNVANTENVIDIMEKEQEGIVLRLMKEIQALNEENKLLKQQLAKYAPNSSLLNSGATSNNSSITPASYGGGLSSRHGSVSSNSSSLSRSSSQRRSTIGGAVAGNSLLNSQRSLPIHNSLGLGFSNYSMNQSYVFPPNASQQHSQSQAPQVVPQQGPQQQRESSTDIESTEPNRVKRKMGGFCPTSLTSLDNTQDRDADTSVDFTNYSFSSESIPPS